MNMYSLAFTLPTVMSGCAENGFRPKAMRIVISAPAYRGELFASYRVFRGQYDHAAHRNDFFVGGGYPLCGFP